MKIAVVYNRDSQNVINLFGRANQEKIGLATIRRIIDSLKSGGHQAVAIEGDKELIDRLEEYMPQVLKGERPGMVFNVSYGIQGNARYTHVPGILEMVGIPYVGSGPLAHSLALDKVVSKMIFKQEGVPTADFVVLNDDKFEAPDIAYPLIVKPKNEAVSFGIKVVHNEKELREGAQVIFDRFDQPVLAEQYIDGREVNVGLLGNNPPEALPPAEILFGKGPKIYTYEDKTRRSGREIQVGCPAKLSPQLTANVQAVAVHAFKALGLSDCARVDMRIDKKGNIYVLEINSLPSMGEHGSYTHAAQAAGLDYAALVNRLVESASARYFGTPKPLVVNTKDRDPAASVFTFLTERRDRIEKRLSEWVACTSRTSDPIGLQEARKRLQASMESLGLKPVKNLSDQRSTWAWETAAGMNDGTLLIGHLDVPLEGNVPAQAYRREPEWLCGEGIGCSRAPLVSMEFALRALRHHKLLRKKKIGVLFYTDEGRDGRYSAETLQAAAERAKQVLVLRPGATGDFFITQRRGSRKYSLTIEGRPRRLGRPYRKPEPLLWLCQKLDALSKLNSRKDYLSIGAGEMHTTAFPMLLPHRVSSTLLVSYLDAKKADELEKKMRELLNEKGGPDWELECITDRPPMKERRPNKRLATAIKAGAERWEIPFKTESSLWPSAAGLMPAKTPVLCGVGPVARDLYTPIEAVQRISLVQRTLLLTQFLMQEGK